MRAYLDWNATTPPLDEVLEAMARTAREAWANPASIHAHGRAARAVVEEAREAVAELGGVDARDVVLTSGGTEANNLAIRSALAQKPGVIVTSRLEHPSVTRVAEALEREGSARVRWLRVTEEGRVDLADVERALAEPDVALLALQAANHETGALQPVREALAMARARGVRVHVDAVQAFGKVDETGPDADTRSLAAHKLRGPKGIGALVSLCGTPLAPVLLGGAQERGLRPGTVDPVAAAGLAVAARHALGGAARHRALAARRDALVARLAPLGGGARAIGAGPRAPHVANLAWPGWAGAELVAALDLEGVSVSSGSACSAGTIEPSPVIAAMLGEAVAAGAVRISLGEATTDAELEHAIAAFTRVLARATEP